MVPGAGVKRSLAKSSICEDGDGDTNDGARRRALGLSVSRSCDVDAYKQMIQDSLPPLPSRAEFELLVTERSSRTCVIVPLLLDDVHHLKFRLRKRNVPMHSRFVLADPMSMESVTSTFKSKNVTTQIFRDCGFDVRQFEFVYPWEVIFQDAPVHDASDEKIAFLDRQQSRLVLGCAIGRRLTPHGAAARFRDMSCISTCCVADIEDMASMLTNSERHQHLMGFRGMGYDFMDKQGMPTPFLSNVYFVLATKDRIHRCYIPKFNDSPCVPLPEFLGFYSHDPSILKTYQPHLHEASITHEVLTLTTLKTTLSFDRQNCEVYSGGNANGLDGAANIMDVPNQIVDFDATPYGFDGHVKLGELNASIWLHRFIGLHIIATRLRERNETLLYGEMVCEDPPTFGTEMLSFETFPPRLCLMRLPQKSENLLAWKGSCFVTVRAYVKARVIAPLSERACDDIRTLDAFKKQLFHADDPQYIKILLGKSRHMFEEEKTIDDFMNHFEGKWRESVHMAAYTAPQAKDEIRDMFVSAHAKRLKDIRAYLLSSKKWSKYTALMQQLCKEEEEWLNSQILTNQAKALWKGKIIERKSDKNARDLLLCFLDSLFCEDLAREVEGAFVSLPGRNSLPFCIHPEMAQLGDQILAHVDVSVLANICRINIVTLEWRAADEKAPGSTQTTNLECKYKWKRSGCAECWLRTQSDPTRGDVFNLQVMRSGSTRERVGGVLTGCENCKQLIRPLSDAISTHTNDMQIDKKYTLQFEYQVDDKRWTLQGTAQRQRDDVVSFEWDKRAPAPKARLRGIVPKNTSKVLGSFEWHVLVESVCAKGTWRVAELKEMD